MSVQQVREWVEVAAADAASRPTVIDDIFARRIDGVTVTGVFPPEVCRLAVEVFERHRAEHHVDAMFGTMLGIPLADLATRVADPRDRTLYLDDGDRNREIHREAFGSDPHARVAEVVTGLAGGREVRTPDEGGRSYASGNIRWFEPDQGGLPSHVDNEFASYTDGTLDHLQGLAQTDGHLSWFVVLQSPTAGGALSVYDHLYRVHQPSQAQWTDRGRDDTDFDELEARQVSPAAGSLVVFGGGWRWHRVDRVLAGRPRVTYGGFAADAHDRSALYLWF